MGNFIYATLYFLITYKCSKIIIFSYEDQVETPKRWVERVKELGRERDITLHKRTLKYTRQLYGPWNLFMKKEITFQRIKQKQTKLLALM